MRKFTILMAVLGLMFTTTAQDLPDYLPTDSLLGYWGFDGDANDYSGNGNNGTVNGATLTEDRHGNANNAYYFSSSSCETRIDIDVLGMAENTGFSISFWMNRIGNGCIYPRLWEFWGNDNPLQCKWANSDESFVCGISSQNISLIDDNWYHVTLTADGDSLKLFINGELNNSSQNSFIPRSTDFAIGRMNHSAWDAFNGKLDDFGIWSRALAKSEIQEIFNGESSADNSGNSFSSVVIGEQEWMSENLRTTHYANGDPIPHITSNSQWTSSMSGAYCWYDNDSSTYENSYGKLYNWYAVNDSRNICPAGWHVPSDAEWTVLVDFLASSGFEGNEGTALKAINGWNDSGNGTDDFGFGGLPGGRRTGTPIFIDFGNNGAWWCSDSDIGNQYAIFRTLHKNSTILSSDQFERKYGRSVRCIKDLECDTIYNTTIDTNTCNIYISEGGKQLTESGVLIDSFVTGNGCDSIVTINVSLNISKFSNDTAVFIVSSANYEGHPLVVDSIGIDSLIQQQNQCDSFVTRYEKYQYEENFYNDTIEVFDTTEVMDTTEVLVYDTQVVTINDTNEVVIDVYDTTYVSVDDTLVITMFSDTTTGIDFLTTEVNVYPNPASTQLNLEIDMSGDYTVSLTNISGQMVFTQANVVDDLQIDISDFTQGLYFITITDNDGVLKAEERKIVIE